jgi:hypothetical protein
MKIKFAALLFIICLTAHKSKAQYVWFSGFSYNAPFLRLQSDSVLIKQSKYQAKWKWLNTQITLANYYHINNNYFRCKQILTNALTYADSNLIGDALLIFSIKTNHLLWEKALFTGRWEEALSITANNEKYIKNPLGRALYQYQSYMMMAKGDVTFIALDKTVLKDLRKNLIDLNLPRMALSIAMQEFHNHFIDRGELQDFINKLPMPIKHVGELELHYHTTVKTKLGLLAILHQLPQQDYISNFRAYIELVKYYTTPNQTDSFYYFLKKAKTLTTYLADADVDNHYNTTLNNLFERRLIITDTSLLVKTSPWHTETRVGVYNYYNNKRIKKVNDQYINQLRTTTMLLMALMLLGAALILVLYKVVNDQKKLTILNEFRNQFVFALSHDLNATLTALENHSTIASEPLLMEHRMMLDDTLLWAQSASKNKGISNETGSLSDLVHETMEQLNSLILLKKINVTWLGDIDEAITINKNAMLVVVRNTLLNTIKHNTQQGFITIDVQASKITLTNSTIHATQSQSKTGSFLINYFTAINNATYAIHINNNVAYTTISIKNL